MKLDECKYGRKCVSVSILVTVRVRACMLIRERDSNTINRLYVYVCVRTCVTRTL